MAIVHMILDARGKARRRFLRAPNREVAPTLPNQSNRYFLPLKGAIVVPLSRLIMTRLRRDGVRNARKLMRRAYDRTHPRRAPISIKGIGNGYFVVEDGNSTAASALAAGWRSIPAIVTRGPTRRT